jgi:acyl carrier protein
MSDRATIEKELRSIIARRMPDRPDPASIASDVPIFRKGLGLDSMSGIELVAEIEEHFGVYIDDDDFDIFDSLDRMIDFVTDRTNRTGS